MTVNVCWSDNGSGLSCGGHVDWHHDGDHWRGECKRCGATGRAAVGEELQLERALGARREASQ